MDSERDQLIKEEMRFLLQQNGRRFGRQLVARLLEEGCNLPQVLARPLFYELFFECLTPLLDDARRKQLKAMLPSDSENISHAHFYANVRTLRTRLKVTEKLLIAAGFDTLAAIIARWHLTTAFFTGNSTRFEQQLMQTVDRFAALNPKGGLARVAPDDIRRRVQMALTTSLLRHGKGMDSFEQQFGSVPEALRAMRADPALFGRVMVFLCHQIPHASYIASRTFWRTLQSIDTDR